MLVNRKSTNDVLLNDNEVRTALDAGKVILLDKVATSNPEYTTLYFLGYVEVESSNTEVSAAQRLLLGWSDKSVYPMRCVQNALTSVADNLTAGQSFDNFALRIVDTNVPTYANQEPRQSKTGETYFDADGHKIYRNVVLVTKEELQTKGHSIIRRVTAKVPSVNASALLQPNTAF